MTGGDSGSGVAPLPRRWLWWWVVVRVAGPSMSPTLRHGDRLLVRRLRPGTAVRPGSVVLARFPARPELLVVKRAHGLRPGGLWVVGDNPLITDDSRVFGAAVVVGRAVFRLWPRPGRLPGPPSEPGSALPA